MQYPILVTGPVGSLALQYTVDNSDRVIEIVRNMLGEDFTPTFREPDVLQYPVMGGMQLIKIGCWIVWDTKSLHCVDDIYFGKNWVPVEKPLDAPDPDPVGEGRAITSYAVGDSTIAEGVTFIMDTGIDKHTAHCIRGDWMPYDDIYGQLCLVFPENGGMGTLAIQDLDPETKLTMNYCGAVEAAKQGHRVCRSGWNGDDMFLVYIPEAEVSTDGTGLRPFFGSTMPLRAHWLLKTAQGDVAVWSPSVSDSLAEDWEIYSPE
ncbi:hypothetical protein [Vibrio phage R01]|nr:hypothetical protein [Vibrio phage R01]